MTGLREFECSIPKYNYVQIDACKTHSIRIEREQNNGLLKTDALS